MGRASPAGQAPAAGLAQDVARAEAQLQQELLHTSRRRDPERFAVVAYRLAMVLGDAVVGDPGSRHQRAVTLFRQSAEAFAEVGSRLGEARARTGAGAALRALGCGDTALRELTVALELLADLDAPRDEASAATNLGVVLSDLGRHREAGEVLAVAMERFDPTTAEGRRGWATACVDRALAAAEEPGDDAALTAAGLYQRVLDEVAEAEAPSQHALAWYGLGMAELHLAGQQPRAPAGAGSGGPPSTSERLDRAERALAEAATRFHPGLWPGQHALCCLALAEVHQQRGDRTSLRRALARTEDALAVLDPRRFAPLRQRATACLAAVETALAGPGPEPTRAEHLAELMGDVDEDERRWWLRERVGRLVALPAGARERSLGELAQATCCLGRPRYDRVLASLLAVVMEWPIDEQAAVLRAQLLAHGRAGDGQRPDLDRALDQAVTAALESPQRVAVRDFLRSLGFERP